MSNKSIPDWVSGVGGGLLLLITIFSAYGTFTSNMTRVDGRLDNLEKVSKVSTTNYSEIENELDVLWIDTQRNKDSIAVVREHQSDFGAAIIKLADATERLSLAVAKLEERTK